MIDCGHEGQADQAIKVMDLNTKQFISKDNGGPNNHNYD